MYQKMFVIVMTKLYKREIFNALRFDEGKIYEDNLIYLQSVYNAGKCAVFPAKLYYYVMSDDSITRSGFSSKKLADIDVQIKFIDFSENISIGNRPIYLKKDIWIKYCFILIFLPIRKILIQNKR